MNTPIFKPVHNYTTMQTTVPFTNTPAKLTGSGEVRSNQGNVEATFFFTINYKNGDSEPEDDFIYQDHVTNLHLKATSFETLVIDGNHAWFTGIGVMDDRQAVRFTVEVNTTPDTFRISIPVLDGYEAGGMLAEGNVTIQ